MQLEPRYEGPVILSIEGGPTALLEPVSRQRRRFERLVAGFGDTEWSTPSRCAGWTNRDVVAHLVSVNQFWTMSVEAGVAGAPTRMLAGFDPAATPPLLVASLGALSNAETLDRFVATNDAFVEALSRLDDDGWSALAETPPGLVPVRLLAQHALWDSWVHERDVLVPVGVDPAVEADEAAVCLRYAAAISPVLGLANGRDHLPDASVGGPGGGAFAVESSGPDERFTLTVGDSVALRDGLPDGPAPVLRGDAVVLTEALSLRLPMPADAPAEWLRMLGGIETAFDAR